MKRWIHSATDNTIYSGFLFEYKDKAVFLKSQKTLIRDDIVRIFINYLCDLRGVADNVRQAALYDKPTLQDFRRRVSRATLECKDTGNIIFYTISGNGFTLNFPEDEFEKTVTLLED